MAPLSSGLALSTSLQDILTRQKVEQRQAMLDEMARKEAESNQLYRAENLKSLQEQRETLNEQRKLGILDSGVYGPDDNVSDLDPEMLAIGKKYGRIKRVPGGSVTTQTQFMAPNPQGETPGTLDQNMAESVEVRPDRDVYRGTPAELSAQRRAESINQMDIPDEIKKVLRLHMLSGGAAGIPGTAMDELLRGQQDMYILDEATGQVTPALGADKKPIRSRSGNPIVTRNRPPQGQQPQYVGLTPDGKAGVVFQGGTFRTAPLPQEGIAPKPSAVKATQYMPVLDNASSQKLADLRAKLGAGWWTSDAARRQYASAAQNDIFNAKASPSVKSAVWDIVNNPAYKGKGVEDIIAEYRGAPGITPQELNELGSLLMQVIEVPGQ